MEECVTQSTLQENETHTLGSQYAQRLLRWASDSGSLALRFLICKWGSYESPHLRVVGRTEGGSMCKQLSTMLGMFR